MEKRRRSSKAKEAWAAVPQMEEIKSWQVIENSEELPVREKHYLESRLQTFYIMEKIATTEVRAKEVRKIVESLIALAVKEKDNFEDCKSYC